LSPVIAANFGGSALAISGWKRTIGAQPTGRGGRRALKPEMKPPPSAEAAEVDYQTRWIP
jgi:hypothetical protein